MSTTKSLKGTQTEKNLLTAFANESQAHVRYAFYAGQAKKDGYVEVEAFFQQTSEQEKAHAKRFFKFLEGGESEVHAPFPAGVIGTTEENLKASYELEYHEMESLYPEYAEIAEKEGFPEIAEVFRNVAIAEGEHSRVYREFYSRIKADTFFKSEEEIVWACRKCGYLHKGKTPPEKCPACAHPQAHFQRKSDAPIAPIKG